MATDDHGFVGAAAERASVPLRRWLSGCCAVEPAASLPGAATRAPSRIRRSRTRAADPARTKFVRLACNTPLHASAAPRRVAAHRWGAYGADGGRPAVGEQLEFGEDSLRVQPKAEPS